METVGEGMPAFRVRRSRRADFEAIHAFVESSSAGRRSRFDRRTLGTLAGDVYVAQEGSGPIRGVVVLGYVRSLAEGRFVAILDGVWAASGWEAVVAPLVAHAEGRARRRGCRRMVVATDAVSGALRTTLRARDYAERPVLVGRLDPAE